MSALPSPSPGWGTLQTIGLLAVLIVASAPPVTAYNLLADNPAEPPRLVDQPGDVTYDSAFPGARDRDYLDVLGAWFDYSRAADTVALFLQVADARGLSQPAIGTEIQFRAFVEVFADGERTGRLTFVHVIDGNGTTVFSRVEWRANPAAINVYYFRYEDTAANLNHRFTVSAAKPGFLEFRMPRDTFVVLGDTMTLRWVSTAEYFDPSGRTGVVWYNRDHSEGNVTYGIAELHPLAKAGAAEVPWEVPTTWVVSTIGVAFLLKTIIGWWCYARLDRQKVLGHPDRAALLARIEASPGLHQAQLMRESGLAPGELTYHLRVLQRTGFVRRLSFHGFACYYAAGTSRDEVMARIAMRPPAARWIVDAVLARPGITARQLARERNMRPSSILYHVRRLAEAGLLERTRGPLGFELRVPKPMDIATAPPRAAHRTAAE